MILQNFMERKAQAKKSSNFELIDFIPIYGAIRKWHKWITPEKTELETRSFYKYAPESLEKRMDQSYKLIAFGVYHAITLDLLIYNLICSSGLENIS